MLGGGPAGGALAAAISVDLDTHLLCAESIAQKGLGRSSVESDAREKISVSTGELLDHTARPVDTVGDSCGVISVRRVEGAAIEEADEALARGWQCAKECNEATLSSSVILILCTRTGTRRGG